MVAEFCGNLATIEYTQQKRKAGKSSNNFRTLYDAAMLSITTYTKKIPRYATILGAIFSGLSFVAIVVLSILKIFYPQIHAMYILFSALGLFTFINLFFIGILGEYLVNMNVRQLHRPLVVEKERLNFGDEDDKETV